MTGEFAKAFLDELKKFGFFSKGDIGRTQTGFKKIHKAFNRHLEKNEKNFMRKNK